MSEPGPPSDSRRVVPRGLVGSVLLASFYAGPIGVFVLQATVAAETLLDRICHACTIAIGSDPSAAPPSMFDLIFGQFFLAAFSGFFTVLIGFLPTLGLAWGIVWASESMPWLARRRAWCVVGAAAGTVLGESVFLTMGPLERTGDIVQVCALGAVTGALCAIIAHHRLARFGAFVPDGPARGDGA